MESDGMVGRKGRDPCRKPKDLLSQFFAMEKAQHSRCQIIPTHNTQSKTVMPQTPTPEKASAFAFNVATNIKLALSSLSTLDEQITVVRDFLSEASHENAVPHGHDIEDVPGTPFQVVFEKGVTDSYHAILCRGVDVSDYLASHVVESAMQVVIDANAPDEIDPDFLREQAEERKLERLQEAAA